VTLIAAGGSSGASTSSASTAAAPAYGARVPPLAGLGANSTTSTSGSSVAMSPRNSDEWNPGSARVHFSGLPPDLVAAAWRGDRGLVAKLLGRREALVTLREEESARTLLHVCAVRGHASLLADVWFFSAESQPPIDARDRSGATALQLACHHGHLRVALLLLRFGADPNAISAVHGGAGSAPVTATDGDEQSAVPPLQCAGGDPLLQAAADEHTCIGGMSPLLLLLRRLSPQSAHIPLYRRLLQLLCREGARLSLADRAGLTPLHVAAAQGRAITAGLLLAAGAHPDVCSRNGRTPLHLACAAGHAPTVALLLLHGGSPSGCTPQSAPPRFAYGGAPPHSSSDDDRSPQRQRSGSPLYRRQPSGPRALGHAHTHTHGTASSTSAPALAEKRARSRSRPGSPSHSSGELRRPRRTPSSSGSEAEYFEEAGESGEPLQEPLTIARRLRRPDIGALLGFRADHALAAPPPASLLHLGDCVLGDELPVSTRAQGLGQLHPAYLLSAKRSCAVLSLPRHSRAQLHALQLQLRLRVGRALSLPQPRPVAEHSEEAAAQITEAETTAAAEQHLFACDDEWDRLSAAQLVGGGGGADSDAGGAHLPCADSVVSAEQGGGAAATTHRCEGADGTSHGHQNVIEWLAVEERGERVHVVMDATRLRAQGLFQYAASFPEHRLPESECCHLLAQLASALCFLQERCRVQRELFNEHVVLLDPSQIYVQIPAVGEDGPRSPTPTTAVATGPRRLLVGTLRVVDYGTAHVDSSVSDAASSAAFTLLLPAHLQDVARCREYESAGGSTEQRSGRSHAPDGRRHVDSVRLIAPEVLEGGFVFGSVIDAWTCGVVLHLLACGELPYRLSSDPVPRKRYIQLYLDIFRGQWHRARARKLLSPEFVDLLAQLLRPDPSARLSVSEIRRHPCMTKHGKALRNAATAAAAAAAATSGAAPAKGRQAVTPSGVVGTSMASSTGSIGVTTHRTSRGARRAAKSARSVVGALGETGHSSAVHSQAYHSPARKRPNASHHQHQHTASGNSESGAHGVGSTSSGDGSSHADGSGDKGMLRLPRRGHQRKRSMHDYASITGLGNRSVP
jgi:ankyrin repeat protein/serine/threonine protein kinase